ncbi:unnamed protein product [Heligmosomoides polygyrus]|uniref:HTH_Tnp_Tc3_1 domain-containing protein n=1 Tax=Heligmosomoides polygyrus TaxID=6339 RepID=A0A183FWQ6_HELPZ|nr:unnamed protein product [Heligmosomoides polygyrus]
MIAAQLGRSLNCINRYLKDTEAYKQKSKAGRPRKLSARDQSRLLRMASNGTQSSEDLRCHLDLPASKWIVLRNLNRSTHIVLQVMKRALRLTDCHKAAKSNFARAHMSTNWKEVR